MAKTPEGRLIESINRGLPKTIHHQSMTFGSRSQNGTPDRYYDGPRSDLWVEYKKLAAMPRSGIVVGNYSTLQIAWMERRYASCAPYAWLPDEQRNVIGIVGLPNRTACIQRTPYEWENGTPIEAAIPLKDITAWIVAFTS